MPKFCVRAWYIAYKYLLNPINLEDVTIRRITEDERKTFDEIIKAPTDFGTQTDNTVSYLGVKRTVNSSWILECVVGIDGGDNSTWHLAAQTKASKLFDAACASLALGANSMDGEYQIFWIAPVEASVPYESPPSPVLKATIFHSIAMSEDEARAALEWWNIINHPSNDALKQAISFWVSGHDTIAHDVFGWFKPFAFLAFFKAVEILSSSVCKSERAKKNKGTKSAYPSIVGELMEQLNSSRRITRRIEHIRGAFNKIREVNLEKTKDMIMFAAKELGMESDIVVVLGNLVDIRNKIIAHPSLKGDAVSEQNVKDIEVLARECLIRFAKNR